MKAILKYPGSKWGKAEWIISFFPPHHSYLEPYFGSGAAERLRDLGFSPFVMIYNKDDFVDCDRNGKPIRTKAEKDLLKKYTKEQVEHFDVCWKIQRWVNNRMIFRSCRKFEEFGTGKRKE